MALGSATSLVLSDSPGLLRHLRLSSLGVVGLAGKDLDASSESGLLKPAATTRSWRAPAHAKLATALDVLLGGLAAEAQETRLSSFMRPVVARSLCVRTVRIVSDAEHGVCANFSRVFARDLHKFVLGRHMASYGCLRAQWDGDHPCAGRDSPKLCSELFVRAMA